MRIVSKFHDYYDSVQGMGQDQGLLYIREESEVDLNWHWPWPSVHYWDQKPWNLYTHVIGFCNKIYPCLSQWIVVGKDSNGYDLHEQQFCYNVEEFDALAQRKLTKKELEVYNEPRKKGKFWRHGGILRWKVVDFFKAFEPLTHKYAKLFDENRSPVFAATLKGYVDNEGRVSRYSGQAPKIVYNARLNEYHFQRVKDTYTAFQEVSMFMSNLAVPMKSIPKMSDDDMVEIKGFNKFSFRKDPSGKK